MGAKIDAAPEGDEEEGGTDVNEAEDDDEGSMDEEEDAAADGAPMRTRLMSPPSSSVSVCINAGSFRFPKWIVVR